MKVVSIHYTLTSDTGEVLDSSKGQGPLEYLEGASNIIPGLESELTGLKAGDKKKVKVKAKDAYGEKNDQLIMQVPRTQFPAGVDLKVGDRFRGGADHHAPIFVVLAVGNDMITLDGNHPLAGQDLNFDVEIMTVRDATSEEVEHGHAHGEHGHHH